MIDPSYIEAIVEYREGASTASVEDWLREHGLGTRPMKGGALVAGGRANFEAAFGVDLRRAEPPVQLPVPSELQLAVSSVTIPRPPQPHR
jgi:hypothetical protein